MPAKIYYDKDADLSLLKNKTIAILGYGSQGHGHAQNLRDSGCNVIVAELPGTANYEQAVKDGFQPLAAAEATKTGRHHHHPAARRTAGRGLPRADSRQPLAGQRRWSAPTDSTSTSGSSICPKACRPSSWRPRGRAPGSGGVRPRGGRALPDRPGRRRRPEALNIGLAYAKGIGGTRAGVIETTFAEETETDLFGEQVVLCGGVSALMKAGFETLVEAGYQPEMAYFECVHEVKLIVDLIYQGGLNYMRYSISNTAEYGDYTRGPRIITDETKAEMKRILDEIQDGHFAREWILENRANAPAFKAMRRKERSHLVEEVGRRLRKLMSWINAKEV